MNLIPLQQWLCDSCGKIILKPQDGWLEWYSDMGTRLESGFRIVHSACQYKEPESQSQNKLRQGDRLDSFTGSDGLVRLISMLEFRKLADSKELITIIRRLQFPYYEEARQHWSQAERDGFFKGINEYWPFLKDTLHSIIRMYGK